MTQSQEIEYQAVSPSDFFYRNREIAGFSNPSRAIYVGVREILENSLDACESAQIPPEIYVRITELSSSGGESGTAVYLLRIQDNGTGVPADQIPACFAQVFYGSKYTLKQNRGTFGMGGKMIAYDTRYNPPAPTVQVAIANVMQRRRHRKAPALLDTGSDITAIPRSLASEIQPQVSHLGALAERDQPFDVPLIEL